MEVAFTSKEIAFLDGRHPASLGTSGLDSHSDANDLLEHGGAAEDEVIRKVPSQELQEL